MTTALFRVDASASLGVGHLARSAVVARAMRALGARVALASTDLPPAIASWLAGDLTIQDVDASIEGTLALVRRGAPDLVVLDGYHLPPELAPALRTEGVRVAAIEDRLEVDPDVDLLIDANLYARQRRPRAPRTDLLGPEYAMLRDAVRARRREALAAAAMPRRVLVTFGGADPAGLLAPALEALSNVESHMDLRVVAPPANPRRSLIDQVASRSPHAVTVLEGVPELADELASCDLVLCAAGTSVLEVCCVGVPAILVPVADNQLRVAATAVELGVGDSAGPPPFSAERLARAVEDLMGDARRRSAMVRRQHALVDGHGARRVALALQSLVSRSSR